MCQVCDTKFGKVMFELSSNKRPRPAYDNGRRIGSRLREYNSKTRIYVSVQNETILENLANRRNRPVALYRELLLKARPDFEGKVRWSQTAGCSCGCSPGFILDHTLYQEAQPIDMWLELNTAPESEPEVDMSWVELAQA